MVPKWIKVGAVFVCALWTLFFWIALLVSYLENGRWVITLVAPYGEGPIEVVAFVATGILALLGAREYARGR